MVLDITFAIEFNIFYYVNEGLIDSEPKQVID